MSPERSNAAAWAAVVAHVLGRGGVMAVAKASGLSRTTIYDGLGELDAVLRKRGGGLEAVQKLNYLSYL